MTAVDVIAALVELLKTDADINALVDDRVFGIELPGKQAKDMPRSTIVVRPAGGTPQAGSRLEHTTTRIDAICHGKTPYEANNLSVQVEAKFRQLIRSVVALTSGDCLIHSINEAGGRISERDPQTNWPTASQAFQVFYAIRQVA